MNAYTVEELEAWKERVFAKAQEFGLSCFPQEFELCDHEQMLGYIVYSGMPSHYPHWSYGKAYEKLKTLYDYGVSGLPYEMVINSHPSIAYLMRDNTLLLQILTMAHVYGHNDFFKNNFYFSFTRPEFTIELFKVHADRVRRYIEDPSIGLEKVERVLDAAHSLSLQCQRNPAFRKLNRKEEEKAALDAARPREHEFSYLEKRPEYKEPDLTKIPLNPDEDILLFIRDRNPFLADWERDLLTIAHEDARYFVPQIETKIMNEGWASFWHKKILEALNLPQGLMVEFFVRHNQVLSPIPGGLNPYHVGFKIWEDIERRYNEARDGKIREEDLREYEDNGWPGDIKKGKSGIEKIFEIRSADRDSSFLDQYLTEKLTRELGLFEHQARGSDRVVTRMADRENWKDVKRTLVQSVSMGTVPVIKVEDADYNNNRVLFLKHYHDGRDLEMQYAEKTLQYVHQLWQREVVLETIVNKQKSLLCFSHEKMIIKPLH